VNALPTAAYSDGGLIHHNPSPFGGAWAYCLVDRQGNRIQEQSGLVLVCERQCGRPPHWERARVTNNETECLALILALEALPRGWSGPVYSDSRNALRAVVYGQGGHYLPASWYQRAENARHYLGRLEAINLSGHPSRDDLARGTTAGGRPVSRHNVWCDVACQRAMMNWEAVLRQSSPRLCLTA
jgi:ribonuclease HI